MADARRVSVGFHGGQVLGLRLSQEHLDELQRALGAAGWHEVAALDGAVRLDLGQVVYVRVESDENRVGF